jgi:hypothetical protein
LIRDGFGKKKRITGSPKSKDAGKDRRHSRDQIWSVGTSAAAEHATIDFALAVFQVNQVAGAIQVVHFALGNAGNAEGPGDFADRSKHLLSSVLSLHLLT